MFSLGPALRAANDAFKFRIVASTGSGWSPYYDIWAVDSAIWWGGSFDLNFRPAVISTPLVTGVIPGPSNFAVANAAIGSNSFTYIYDGTHLWGVSSSLATIRKFNPNTLAQSEFSKSNGGYVIVGPTGDVWVKRSSTVFGKLDKTSPAGADLVTRTFSSTSQSAILTGGASDFLVVAVSGGIVRRIGTAGTEASVTLPGAGAYTPTLAWDSYRKRLFAIVEGMKTAWDIDLESMAIVYTRTWTGLATADRARHVYDPVSGYLWMARFFGTGRHFDVAAIRAFDGALVHNERVSSGVLGGTVLGGNNELREILIGPGRSLYAVSPYSTGSSLALVGAVKLPSTPSLGFVFSDTFTDTNGTALSAHTPDAVTPGWSWGGTQFGTPEIQSNTLVSANGSAPYYSALSLAPASGSATLGAGTTVRFKAKASGTNAMTMYGQGIALYSADGLVFNLNIYYTAPSGGELRGNLSDTSGTLIETGSINQANEHTVELVADGAEAAFKVNGTTLGFVDWPANLAITRIDVLVLGGTSYITEIYIGQDVA